MRGKGHWADVLTPAQGLEVDIDHHELVAAISEVVESHGAAWLREVGDFSQELVGFEPRRRSALAVIDLRSGTRVLRLLVKAVASGATSAEVSRPLLVDRTEPGDRLEAEYLALERLSQLGSDDRFFAIEPLGFFTDPAILVMEWCAFPSMAARLDPRASPSDAEDRWLENTGAWLARFHALDSGQAVAYDHRRDLVRLFEGLAPQRTSVRPRRPFERLRTMATERAGQLKSEVPLALLHGDMAPRNILIAPDGSVGGIDVAMRWRAPILHDLAAFWLALRVSRLRLRDPRAGRLDRWYASFLGGYGLDNELRPALDVYCALLLLDRAAAAASVRKRRPELALLAVEASGLVRKWRHD